MSNKGLFITIEGCEGSGKSTQLRLLKEVFAQRNIPALFTREPGGTRVAEQIREIILSPDNDIHPMTELFLYQAARREHVTDVIVPALRQGKVVVCDRFIHSTIAYQGYGRGLELDLIDLLNTQATSGAGIDLAIFLDLLPEKGFLRKGGANKKDRMDSQDIDFHQRVYQGFVRLVQQNRMVKIDAHQEKNAVLNDILHAINSSYRRKRLSDL